MEKQKFYSGKRRYGRTVLILIGILFLWLQMFSACMGNSPNSPAPEPPVDPVIAMDSLKWERDKLPETDTICNHLAEILKQEVIKNGNTFQGLDSIRIVGIKDSQSASNASLNLFGKLIAGHHDQGNTSCYTFPDGGGYVFWEESIQEGIFYVIKIETRCENVTVSEIRFTTNEYCNTNTP